MRQKEAALGLVPGALSKVGSSSKSGALVASSSTAAARLAAEDLYRDGNTLTYGDNKPSEEAIDRVVSKLNQEYVLRYTRREHESLIFLAASTRRTSSPGNARMRTRATLLTSTNTTRCSTRRCEHSFLLFLISQLTLRISHDHLDCPVLRQVHERDPGQLRTGDSAVNLFYLCMLIPLTTRVPSSIFRLRVNAHHSLISVSPGGPGYEREPICNVTHPLHSFISSVLAFCHCTTPSGNRICNCYRHYTGAMTTGLCAAPRAYKCSR